MKEKRAALIVITIILVIVLSYKSLGADGLDIEYPEFSILRLNTDYEFEFHIYNKSNGVPMNSTVECHFHLYNSSGAHLYTARDDTPKNSFDYSFDVRGTNFSYLGDYGYIVQCNTSSLGGMASVPFKVKNKGHAENYNNFTFFQIILVFLFFLTFLGVLIYKIRKEWIRVVLSMIWSIFLVGTFRMLSWIASITNPAETILITTLDRFYSFSIQFMYIVWVVSIFFLLVLMLRLFFQSKERKNKGVFD